MSDGGPRIFRDITNGVIGTVATLATAAAGVLGVLHETGYLKGSSTPSPAAIAVPANAPASNRQIAPANAVYAGIPSNRPYAAGDGSMPDAAAGLQNAPNPNLERPLNQNAHRLRNQALAHPRTRNLAAAPMNSAIASNGAANEMAPRAGPGSLNANSGGQPNAPPHLLAVSGAWKDSGMGYCHVIKQTGAKLEVVNLAPLTSTFVSAGVGNMRGREVHLRLNVQKPAAANAELYLSDDGNKLVGTIKRPNGEFPVQWHRVGPTCG